MTVGVHDEWQWWWWWWWWWWKMVKVMNDGRMIIYGDGVCRGYRLTTGARPVDPQPRLSCNSGTRCWLADYRYVQTILSLPERCRQQMQTLHPYLQLCRPGTGYLWTRCGWDDYLPTKGEGKPTQDSIPQSSRVLLPIHPRAKALLIADVGSPTPPPEWRLPMSDEEDCFEVDRKEQRLASLASLLFTPISVSHK